MSDPKAKEDRRSFLRAGLLGSAGVVGTLALMKGARAAAQLCRETPPQTKGPFYPVHDQLDKDNDLTSIQGRNGIAKGQIVYVMGQLTDHNCQPIVGGLVEIWQACETGKYNHPNDPNPAALDPDFQYFGKSVTDQNGNYLFKTIIPGAYPAADEWIRPPHIHFRVVKLGFQELITQMYFAGDALNDKDEILQALTPEEQDAVIVTLAPAPLGQYEPGSKIGTFPLSMKPIRRRPVLS